jgi:aminotransferase
MNYDGIMSSRIQQVQPSGIRKFFDILEEMKDAISLGVGEPDFVTPWEHPGRGHLLPGKRVHQVHLQRRHGRAAPGDRRLSERRFRLHYDFSSQIIVTVGGSEAIDLALRGPSSTPGTRSSSPVPSFVCYGPLTSMAAASRLCGEPRRRMSSG